MDLNTSPIIGPQRGIQSCKSQNIFWIIERLQPRLHWCDWLDAIAAVLASSAYTSHSNPAS